MASTSDYSGYLNLLKLVNARRAIVSGQKCILIPVEDNPSIFVNDNGAFLGIRMKYSPNEEYDSTHFVAASISNKEHREELKAKMDKKDFNALTPILGNMKEWVNEYSEPSYESESETEDIPF